MTSIVDKYYRRIIQNIDNVRMKFDISTLLVKSKEHDSKISKNSTDIVNLQNNIPENLNDDINEIITNQNNISKNYLIGQTNKSKVNII